MSLTPPSLRPRLQAVPEQPQRPGGPGRARRRLARPHAAALALRRQQRPAKHRSHWMRLVHACIRLSSLGGLKSIQGDPSGWLKPPVDLDPMTVMAAAQAGWRNIPNPSQREVLTIQMGHPVLESERWYCQEEPPSLELSAESD